MSTEASIDGVVSIDSRREVSFSSELSLQFSTSMNKGRRAGRGELSGGPERGTKALVLTRPINRMNLVSEGVDKKRNPGLFHDKKKMQKSGVAVTPTLHHCRPINQGYESQAKRGGREESKRI